MNKGFTLVEVLVVLAMAAVMLVVVSSISVNGTLQKSRDQKRKGDLELIRSALERYKADNHAYPAQLNWSTSLAPTYMDAVADPLASAGRSYYYSVSGNTYQVCAAMEVTQNQFGTCVAGSCGSAGCNYVLNQP